MMACGLLPLVTQTFKKVSFKKKKMLIVLNIFSQIVMACGGGDQRLAAFSETERDSWIEVLHMAAYSYIQVSYIIMHIYTIFILFD